MKSAIETFRISIMISRSWLGYPLVSTENKSTFRIPNFITNPVNMPLASHGNNYFRSRILQGVNEAF
jgi:hypothetical protein